MMIQSCHFKNKRNRQEHVLKCFQVVELEDNIYFSIDVYAIHVINEEFDEELSNIIRDFRYTLSYDPVEYLSQYGVICVDMYQEQIFVYFPYEEDEVRQIMFANV